MKTTNLVNCTQQQRRPEADCLKRQAEIIYHCFWHFSLQNLRFLQFKRCFRHQCSIFCLFLFSFLTKCSSLAAMRAVQCSIYVLCLLILTDAKREPGQEKRARPRQPPPSPQPAKRPRNRSVLSSGELTTKDGHSCTWQTSGEGLVSLLVNCSTEAKGDLERWDKHVYLWIFAANDNISIQIKPRYPLPSLLF